MMDPPRQPIVAIDGPAGSGKSTVAQQVARRAGLQFISSGAMYRATALLALRAGVTATERERFIGLAEHLPIRFTTDADGHVQTWLDDEDVTAALNESAVGQIASVIATIPELRAHLVRRQQEYGRSGGIIMEGRDIQTVVFPDAEIKVFLTASADERARRRWQELKVNDAHVNYRQVLEEVRARDRRDAEREASPLRAASDAVTIDTDGKTIEQVIDRILRLIDAWRAHPELRGAALAKAAGIL